MHVYDYAIKHIILILLASAGLACAELSPEEFNAVRNRALTVGYYYSGTSQVDGDWYYTFCNEKDGLVAFIPMWVTTAREAGAAADASVAAFITGAQRWKRPLDQLLRATNAHLEDDATGLPVALPIGWELESLIKTK